MLPSAHSQVYLLGPSVHLAPFLQGVLAHSSMSTWQRLPENPKFKNKKNNLSDECFKKDKSSLKIFSFNHSLHGVCSLHNLYLSRTLNWDIECATGPLHNTSSASTLPPLLQLLLCSEIFLSNHNTIGSGLHTIKPSLPPSLFWPLSSNTNSNARQIC